LSVVRGKRIQSFRELVVWQRAFALCLQVYRATEALPKHERYGLVAELRKTARSVVYNIAEGQRRVTRREFARFLEISLGSCGELVTQLLLCEALNYLPQTASSRLLADVEEVSRMVYRLRERLLLSSEN
jgi:four helix bundle protein